MKVFLLLCFVLFSFSVCAQVADPCCISATGGFSLFAGHARFVNSHPAPLPFHYGGDKGEWITFRTSDTLDGRGFEVRSAKATGNVIIMIHEWWGLNDYVQREAEVLQQELGDVTVLALDLYDGKVASTREEASKYLQSMREERAIAIINGAIAYVGDTARIGTIGWCFGGGWSLQASLLAGRQAAACVMYYGMPEKNVDRLKTLNTPVLGIFGERDAHINPKIVAEFERNMKEANKDLTVKSYDADHGFANPSNPKHDRAATADAHKHVMAFFTKYLLR